MEINSSNYLSAYLYSTPSVSSTSSGSDFTSLLRVEESNSLAGQMASLGAESMGQAPDFDSMSLEEFQDHLCELQASLAAYGVDISDLADPSTLSTEELEALKEEMSSRGKNPPPPPPMEMMNLNFVDYSNIADDMLENILGVL